MNGPELLRQNVGRLKSRMGAFYPGERTIFRGRDLHADLKDAQWLDLYVFGITGRRHTPEQLRLMNALWVYTSYPDPRLWNNRVAALAGSARSTGNLGVSAALAVSEAHIYGRGNEVQAINFFIATQQRLAAGADLDECVREEMAVHGRIAGYGRPLINADERIAPTMALAGSLGLDAGLHVQLAYRLERFLLDKGRNLRMNYGGLVSAFGADLGFSPSEFYLFMFPSFLAGMQPCFIEAAERPEGATFPVPCANILYDGAPQRAWPARHKAGDQ
ncbi:MAG: hypothetical protein Q7U97_08410 [Rhodocyclaceae bacterium]|nr:hypothetical protein [Rhodocyclaceae bacterium]